MPGEQTKRWVGKPPASVAAVGHELLWLLQLGHRSGSLPIEYA